MCTVDGRRSTHAVCSCTNVAGTGDIAHWLNNLTGTAGAAGASGIDAVPEHVTVAAIALRALHVITYTPTGTRTGSRASHDVPDEDQQCWDCMWDIVSVMLPGECGLCSKDQARAQSQQGPTRFFQPSTSQTNPEVAPIAVIKAMTRDLHVLDTAHFKMSSYHDKTDKTNKAPPPRPVAPWTLRLRVCGMRLYQCPQ